MGADGGIKITKISDIKKDWSKIKDDLIRCFEREIKSSDEWEKKYHEEYLMWSMELPDDIESLSGEDVCKLFSYLSSCDCPYLYEDSMITAEGDYVSDRMDILSRCLNGISIETWT